MALPLQVLLVILLKIWPFSIWFGYCATKRCCDLAEPSSWNHSSASACCNQRIFQHVCAMCTCKLSPDFLESAANSRKCSNLRKNLNKPAQVLKDTNQRISSQQFWVLNTTRAHCTTWGVSLQKIHPLVPPRQPGAPTLCLKDKVFQLKLNLVPV